MFKAISAAFEGTLAPDVPAVVDFRHQWNTFLRFYAEQKPQPLTHKTQPIEGTHLVLHLNNMLKLLVKEQQQQQQQQQQMGACLEFMLQYQVLDVLSSLCQADTPPGIRPYIFNLFTFLVGKVLDKTTLSHASVFPPIRRLLMLSATTKASPTEGQELTFISALVVKLRAEEEGGQLIALFAHEQHQPSTGSNSRRSSASVDTSHIEELLEKSAPKAIFEDFERKHLPASALMNMIESSADYLVTVKAMDALLNVSSLDNDSAARNAVEGSKLHESMAERLIELYTCLPVDRIDAAMIEEVRVNWIEAHHLHDKSGILAEFPGKSELVSFFSWLDFCDNLVKTAAAFIAEAAARSIRERFFEAVIETEIQNDLDEGSAVFHLALITQCWTHIHSDGLASEFSSWLFSEHNVTSLLTLCRSRKAEVTLEALSLFDVILERPCDPILQTLVLYQLSARAYYNSSLAESAISSWSDEEDERERRISASRDIPEEVKPDDEVEEEVVMSRTMAPTNIARIINAWLFLVPDEWRSSDSAKDSGYEQYVKNARNSVAETFKKCGGFRNWPREATFFAVSEASSNWTSRPGSDFSSSEDSRPEVDGGRDAFFEGHFLSALFDLLASPVERPYEVNLQVTAVLARLAQLPHPFLHEYLLDPTVPLAPGARSMFTTIRAALDGLKAEAGAIERLDRKIFLCRKTLIGDGDSTVERRAALGLDVRETKVIDALIVLEEFSKEIAAIALAKYHHAS